MLLILTSVVVVRTPTVPTNARIAIKAIMAIKIIPFSSQPGIPACHRSGRVSAGKSVDIVPNVFDYVLNSYLICLSGMGMKEKLWKPLNKGINALY